MNSVLQCYAYCLDYFREQVADLSDVEMVAQPNGILNHPAWVSGHLAASCQALGREIGLLPWLPPTCGQRFGMGSVPLSDPTAYESKSELLEILRDAQARITAAVEDLQLSQLDEPLRQNQYGEVVPTLRHAVTQMLVAHSAYHVGQLAIWRRLMGLQPIQRPFL